MNYDALAWMSEGPCRETDPEIFFPIKGEVWAARAAKQICAGCPVLGTCLAYAMNRNEMTGVWGGTTASERAYLRRKKMPA